MRIPAGNPRRGHLWPTMALALAFLFSLNNFAFASKEPQFNYSSSPPSPSTSPPPPPPPPSPLSPSYNYYYNSPPPLGVSSPPPPPPPPHHEPLVKVVGTVHCDECYDWKIPVDSHLKKPLKDVVVKLTCVAGNTGYVDVKKTNKFGKYSLTVKGFPYWQYKAKACKVVLITAPKGSKCNLPTNLNKDLHLKVIVKSHELVVLKAKPLAFAPKTPYEECGKPKPPTYKYNSPPPPTSTYYYKSPPLSSPSPSYYNPPPPSSPSPLYSYDYKPPPPPSPSPLPPPSPSPATPYYYSSATPPSPSLSL